MIEIQVTIVFEVFRVDKIAIVVFDVFRVERYLKNATEKHKDKIWKSEFWGRLDIFHIDRMQIYSQIHRNHNPWVSLCPGQKQACREVGTASLAERVLKAKI